MKCIIPIHQSWKNSRGGRSKGLRKIKKRKHPSALANAEGARHGNYRSSMESLPGRTSGATYCTHYVTRGHFLGNLGIVCGIPATMLHQGIPKYPCQTQLHNFF